MSDGITKRISFLVPMPSVLSLSKLESKKKKRKKERTNGWTDVVEMKCWHCPLCPTCALICTNSAYPVGSKEAHGSLGGLVFPFFFPVSGVTGIHTRNQTDTKNCTVLFTTFLEAKSCLWPLALCDEFHLERSDKKISRYELLKERLMRDIVI